MKMPLPFISDRVVSNLHMHTCRELQTNVWPGDTFVASIIGNVMALFHCEIGRPCDTPSEPYDQNLQQGRGGQSEEWPFHGLYPSLRRKECGIDRPMSMLVCVHCVNRRVGWAMVVGLVFTHLSMLL